MKKYIGELLISEGYITEASLKNALNLQKNNKILLGEALMTIDAITKTELTNFLLKYKNHDEVYKWAKELFEQDEIDKLLSELKKN